MKTLRHRSGEASCFVCDDCYPALARWVWVVPGLVPCFGTCSECGEWASVRDLVNARPGGRKSAPTGTCPTCENNKRR